MRTGPQKTENILILVLIVLMCVTNDNTRSQDHCGMILFMMGVVTLMEEFLMLFMISTMNSLFLLKSFGVILRDPSNRKTRSTDFFVQSVNTQQTMRYVINYNATCEFCELINVNLDYATVFKDTYNVSLDIKIYIFVFKKPN